MRNKISRRQFLSTGAAVTLATPVAAQQAGGGASTPNPGPGVWVHWLDGGAPVVDQGVTCEHRGPAADSAPGNTRCVTQQALVIR